MEKETKRNRRRNRAKDKFRLEVKVPNRPKEEIEWFKEEAHSIKYQDLKIKSKCLLGQGASGKVLKVFHNNRPYALKIIKYGFGVPPSVIINEKKSLHLSAKGKYVVRFFEGFHIEGSIRLLLEFMDCGSLESICRMTKTIPEPILSKITYQLLMGLNFLEQKGIIHRDIKPSNVLLNHYGRVKLSDFGLSNQMSNSLAKKGTVDFFSFKGTYIYMSPERLQGESYGFNSDIWSLGLAVMECFLGRFPFDESDQHDVWNYLFYLNENLKNKTYNFLNKPCSKELKDFFFECMALERKKRPKARDLLQSEFITKHYTENHEQEIAEWLRNELLGKKRKKN